MAWVIDTSVILDLVLPGSPSRAASLACLQQHLADGLCVCPISFVEVGPAFGGDSKAAETFFQVIPGSISEPWTMTDTETAHRLWHDHQVRRRATQVTKRPIADILIAAFSVRFQGLITRNASDFRTVATLTIVEP